MSAYLVSRRNVVTGALTLRFIFVIKSPVIGSSDVVEKVFENQPRRL